MKFFKTASDSSSRVFSSKFLLLRVNTFNRHLHLHEYQSKELMNSFGINTQKFITAQDGSEAMQKCSNFLKSEEFVIKAQVLAGGRGKGCFTSGLQGGVQLTKSIAEVSKLVDLMVNNRLITHQTGKEGVMVHKVMVAEAEDLKKETYVAILLDRSVNGAVIVCSPKGGVDIEAVAEETPGLIFKERIVDIVNGPTIEQLERIVLNLGLIKVKEQVIDQLQRLYKLFRSVDATTVEVNPFGLTPNDKLICFDAKITFDDNAAYRQIPIFAMEDQSEPTISQTERKAQKIGLNYIGMDGNVGCLVNGAGLAMATMDILKLYGGEPANFLDVGGNATVDQIASAYQLLAEDEQVKTIFVNIFGGIMRCDLIAEGILKAVNSETTKRSIPLVIRLAGTNEMIAKERLIKEYPNKVEIFKELDEAAKTAVDIANDHTATTINETYQDDHTSKKVGNAINC